MAFQIDSTSGKGNFTVRKEGKEVITVDYQGWFSSKASATLNGSSLEIRPRNIWQSNFDILIDGVDHGDIIFNWKGNVIIRKANVRTESEDEFMLRSKGFWKQHFELLDHSDRVYLRMFPKFNWKTFTYSYAVEQGDHDLSDEQITEMLIYCGFGANLYMAMTAGAAAGAG